MNYFSIISALLVGTIAHAQLQPRQFPVMELPYAVVLPDSAGAIVPDVVYATWDSSLLTPLSDLTDMSDTEWSAIGQCKWQNRYTLCFAGLRWGWWNAVALAVFDDTTKEWIQVLKLNFLTGGDGGQSYAYSWFKDLNQDGVPEIIIRPQERWMDPIKVKEHIHDEVEVMQWKAGRFVSIKPKRPRKLIKAFPVEF